MSKEDPKEIIEIKTDDLDEIQDVPRTDVQETAVEEDDPNDWSYASVIFELTGRN